MRSFYPTNIPIGELQKKMPSAIRPNDILWTRNGDPTLVDKINENSGGVYLDDRFSRIQEESKNGIKNGLPVTEREAFKNTMSSLENSDKIKEIQDLFHKIKSLKESNTDPRLLKYLNSELQFRMVRENYKPEDFEIKPVTLDI